MWVGISNFKSLFGGIQSLKRLWGAIQLYPKATWTSAAFS